MFKMAFVRYGTQTGSGAEVVCYSDMGKRGGATGFLTLRPHFLTDLAVIFMTRPRSIKKIGSASPENMIYGKNLILNQIFF